MSAGCEVAHAGWAVLNFTDKEHTDSQDVCSCRALLEMFVCVGETQEEVQRSEKESRIRNESDGAPPKEKGRMCWSVQFGGLLWNNGGLSDGFPRPFCSDCCFRAAT